MEVDDVQSSSPDHSMWCKGGTAGWDYGFLPISYNLAEKVYLRQYIGVTANDYHMIEFMDTNAVFGAGNAITTFYFDGTDNIKMYDSTTLTDTGFNYTAGAWKQLEIQFNFGADTFDAWYDSDLIADDWNFYQSANSVERISFVCHATGTTQMWIDDIQFGEQGFSISPAQAGPMSGGVTI